MAENLWYDKKSLIRTHTYIVFLGGDFDVAEGDSRQSNIHRAQHRQLCHVVCGLVSCRCGDEASGLRGLILRQEQGQASGGKLLRRWQNLVLSSVFNTPSTRWHQCSASRTRHTRPFFDPWSTAKPWLDCADTGRPADRQSRHTVLIRTPIGTTLAPHLQRCWRWKKQMLSPSCERQP